MPALVSPLTLQQECDAWRELAGELRHQQKRIQGILMDVDWEMDEAVLTALVTIDVLVNGPEGEP